MLNPLGNINPQTKTRQKLEQTTNQNLSECVSTKTSATHKIETSQSVSPQNHEQPKNWNLSKCVFTRNIMNPQTKTSRKVSPQKHEPSYENPTKNNQQPTNSKTSRSVSPQKHQKNQYLIFSECVATSDINPQTVTLWHVSPHKHQQRTNLKTSRYVPPPTSGSKTLRPRSSCAGEE